MKRRIAVVADTLSSGGQILDYAQSGGFTFHGHKVALIGGLAHCTTCNSDGTIAKAGGPTRLGFGGPETALDKDVVHCKCPTPPTIVAALAGDSYCDDDVETKGAVSSATVAGGAAVAVAALAGASTSGASSASAKSPSTPLGDAQPFEYGKDTAAADGDKLAASGVSEADEAECHAQYNEDMEACSAMSAVYGSKAYYRSCSERAFNRYQQCRGY